MKYRIIFNGEVYRAQVKWFLFWLDIDGGGWTRWELCWFAYDVSARSAVRKHQDNCERHKIQRGPWRVVEE